jgi:MFS family permease
LIPAVGNYIESNTTPSQFAMSQSQKYQDTLASSAALQADIEANKSPRSGSKKSKKQGTNGFVKGLYSILCVLQIIGAALIISLTAVRLDVDVETTEGVYSKEFCYQLNDSVNTCTYTYWSAGISISVSLLLLIFAAVCHGVRGRCCLTIETILSMCGVAWWVAAGVVSTITSDNADGANLGEHSARLALWIMCYTVGGLFGGTMLLSMGTYVFDNDDAGKDDSKTIDSTALTPHPRSPAMCCRGLLPFLLPRHQG